MVTGASTANLAIILIDARHGVAHADASGIRSSPLARHPAPLDRREQDGSGRLRAGRLRPDRRRLPGLRRSARGPRSSRSCRSAPSSGDNVVARSDHMPWYHGETVLEYLEKVYIGSDRNLVDFRLPDPVRPAPSPRLPGLRGPDRLGRGEDRRRGDGPAIHEGQPDQVDRSASRARTTTPSRPCRSR